MSRVGWIVAAAAIVAAPDGARAQQDTVAMTVEAAVERALDRSQEVRLARTLVEAADARVRETRAGALPQVNANLAYTRTFASAFQGSGGFELPDSLRFSPDTTASLAERVRYLERRVPLAGLEGLGNLFADLPFAQENVYAAQLSGSQLLFSGGRTGAALRIARDFQAVARLGLAEEAGEIELRVRTAYYRALLAREMETIALAALEQAEAFLAQERLRLAAGRASELEVLRAEVSRDNLRPQVVGAQNAVQLATLDLKRLMDLPLTTPLRLVTPLDAPEIAPDARIDGAEATAGRAAIAAAERQVAMREEGIRIARGAFLPSVQLQMNYGRQLFPSGAFAFDGSWRTDWTATLGVQVPIFSGGQRLAQLQTARVEAERARLQLDQLRQAVLLQYEQAAGERARAAATISARQTTVGAAQRVYELTNLRYQQGLATQLEVSQARLELLQARTNLAQAVGDYLIADAAIDRAAGAR
jgi:outer membrane protein